MKVGKSWISVPRLLAIAVTGALLFYIFRQLPLRAVRQSLEHLKPLWFLAALATYGVSLGLGGLRSHIAFRLTDRSVHATASCRAYLAGHFFFVVLLGAAAGDIAKCAVYARWYGFGMAEVLAAPPLDRLLGLGGIIILFVIIAVLVLVNHGFGALQKLDVEAPNQWIWLVSGVVLLGVIALLIWAPQGDAAWKRTIRSLRSGMLRLFRTPALAVDGVTLAILAQAGLSAVIALCLAAVTERNLYWGQIAWTFPAIMLISSLPFTVAGAGVREAAALALLGLYNVPAGDCVAAALLTLVCKLLWAGVGAAVLWHEEIVFSRATVHVAPKTISVVIPTLNEAQSLAETVRQARQSSCVCEVIVADGGSHDGTAQLAQTLGCRVLVTAPGRGGQLRAGAAEAKGDVILLLHADTWMPAHACEALLNCMRDRALAAGGFWKVFRDPAPLLLGSKIKCGIRLLLGRRILGDQGIFVRREVLEAIGGVPDVPLMEDFELCRRLRKRGRLALADATVITSARRFKKLGIIRTYLRMWRVTWLYRFGVSPRHLKELYERE